MVEGVGVSDEQLDETGLRAIEGSDHMRMAGQFGHDPDGWFRGTVRDLVGEVRASHARETELQQRIDKALVALEETVRYDRQPTMNFSSTDALYSQFTRYLERVEQSWAQQAASVRAALADAGNESTEETR